MKTIIVAYDKNRGIGAANGLLWGRDLPADLQHFKDVTMGGAMIMGRKTFDSIGRLLPGRQTIIMSRDSQPVDGATVVTSLQAAYQAVKPGRGAFVVGGGQIYALAIDTVDRIIATEVQEVFAQADTFFPSIDTRLWHETNRQHHEADERNRYGYDFVTYDRR
jgi:dihydrofolate reductase